MDQQLIQFATNHLALCSAFIGILILIAINELITYKRSPKMLSTAAVVEYINQEKAVIIDLRPDDAFNSGHIIGAIRASADDVKRIEQYKTKPLILVCARGLQSNTFALKLRKLGFDNPMVLSGGMSAWQTASLPVVKGKKK